MTGGGGAGGTSFAVTGAGTNVTILGGNFNAVLGGCGGQGNGSLGLLLAWGGLVVAAKRKRIVS